MGPTGRLILIAAVLGFRTLCFLFSARRQRRSSESECLWMGKGEGEIDPITGHTRTMVSSDGVGGRFSATSSVYTSLLAMKASPERYCRDTLWCAASLRASTMDPTAAQRIVVVVSVISSHVFVEISGDFSSPGLSTTTVDKR